MSEWRPRLEIDPDPSDEELVAILAAVRGILEADGRPAVVPALPDRENWRRAARREGLRPGDWPYQLRGWAGP